MLDLKKFVQETQAIVPVVKQGFQYNRKKYLVPDALVDGWYKVAIQGNNAKVLSVAVIEMDREFAEQLSKNSKAILKGFTYHNNFIPQNFDVAKRNSLVGVMTPLLFNNVPTFSSIEAILWEDKNLYYYRPNYSDARIYVLRRSCDEDADITILKGITPEQRTLYVFHNIEKIKIREEQERVLKEKELEAFRQTLQGRLILAFSRVNAKIIKYSVAGNRVEVHWELRDYSQLFKSVIEADTLRVIEAGYCMSGDDRNHNVHSMVELVKDYIDDDVLHITRT